MKKRNFFYVIECELEGEHWPIYNTEGACSSMKWVLELTVKELKQQPGNKGCKFSIVKYAAEKQRRR